MKCHILYIMSVSNLVTTCNFHGSEYFIKMNASDNTLELNITDKQSGEDWQCCYDATYIENVTQKTGNFKQFHIFVAMLRSGLLKTSGCIYLELMTFEDLDTLRNHRTRKSCSSYHMAQTNTNRRYLILTYSVEFDRIHYPLPLEYCGPPDPKILQRHILSLENEIVQLKKESKNSSKHNQDTRTILSLQKRIEDLSDENQQLFEENRKLKYVIENSPKHQKQMQMLQNAIKNLEKSVLTERKSHHKLVEKLRKDKHTIRKQLERARSAERLLRTKIKSGESSLKIKRVVKSRSVSPKSCHSGGDSGPSLSKRLSRQKGKLNRRSRSSSTGSSRCSYLSPKRELMKTSPKQQQINELDFSTLENRIQSLQQKLQDGFAIF